MHVCIGPEETHICTNTHRYTHVCMLGENTCSTVPFTLEIWQTFAEKMGLNSYEAAWGRGGGQMMFTQIITDKLNRL